jgi:tetratricopeptide (TPR) repeat protein
MDKQMDTQKISDLIVASYEAEKMGKTSLAITGWNKLLQEDIDNELQATTYLNLAKLHQAEGNNDLALENINLAIKANPQNAEGYFVLGYFEFENQHFQQALEYFNQAYNLNNQDIGLVNNIANCYDRLADFENAVLFYTKALELDKNYIASYYNRGNVLTKLKQYDDALADLNSAIKLDADFYQAYYNRGNIYELLGKKDLAQADKTIAQELAKQDLKDKNHDSQKN